MEVSEIIESVDILEYISQFCDPQEKEDGEYWCLSPLKDENTPSFSINKEIQRFYDFSSGQGGNVLDFIRAYYHCDFRKGLRILKDYAGIVDGKEAGAGKRLLATSVAKRFQYKPPKEKGSKVSVLPGDYMDRYERNEKKFAVWEREGITRESMERFQVRYDPFSDRLVYPVRDVDGNIISVCGRTLDPDFKAKKLRKYTYFQSLGTLDTIFRNCGAILTSHLNPRQFKILIKLGVKVSFALDAEIDIRQDTNIVKLRQYVPVYWVRNRRNLLEPKDSPVDKGPDVFRYLYQEKVRLR